MDAVPHQAGQGGADSGADGQGLGTRVRGGAVWSAASVVALRLASLGVTAIMARLLAPEDFGVYAVAATVFVIVGPLAELGTISAINRADWALDESAPTITTITVTGGCVMGTVMALLAEPFASALGTPQATNPIRVLALGMAVGSPFIVPVAQLSRDFRQRAIFAANLAGFLPSSALMLALAYQGNGAMAFVWSRLLSQVVTGSAALMMVARRYRPGLSWPWARVILSFGLPLSGSAIIANLNLNVDYMAIARIAGTGDVGLYMLAFNVSGWSTALATAIIQAVVVPTISRVRERPSQLSGAITSAVRLVSYMSFGMGFMTLALAVPLVVTLYGERFGPAAPALVALSVYGALYAFVILLSNVLIGLGRTGILLWVQVAVFAFLAPTVVAGVAHLGIFGAGLAQTVVVCLVTIPAYLLSVARVSSTPATTIVKAVGPGMLAAAVAGVTAWLASQVPDSSLMQLLVGVVMGSVVWVILTGRYLIPIVSGRRGAVD